MTDSGFTTEVHHINEEGENAGTFFSEKKKNVFVSRCIKLN